MAASYGVTVTTAGQGQYAAIQEWAEQEIIDRLVLGALDLHKYAVIKPLPKGSGKVVRWTRPVNFGVAGFLTEGASPTAVASSAYTLTATVVQRGLVTTASDIWEASAIAGFVSDNIENMRDSLRISMDKHIRDLCLIGNVYNAQAHLDMSAVKLWHGISDNFGYKTYYCTGEHGGIAKTSTVMSANVPTVADVRAAAVSFIHTTPPYPSIISSNI